MQVLVTAYSRPGKFCGIVQVAFFSTILLTWVRLILIYLCFPGSFRVSQLSEMVPCEREIYTIWGNKGERDSLLVSRGSSIQPKWEVLDV